MDKLHNGHYGYGIRFAGLFSGYSGEVVQMSKPLTGSVFDGSYPSYAITRFKKIVTAATGLLAES